MLKAHLRIDAKSCPRTVAAAAAISAALTLSACGTGRTTITAAPSQHISARGVQIVEGTSTVTVPAEVRTAFQQQLEKALYEKAGFQRGTDLTLRHRWVQFAAGDRFQRWFWGGIGNAGEGSMTIETVYLDRDGQELAKTMTEGRIGSGFFGGSMDSALEKAVDEIVKYTVSTFK